MLILILIRTARLMMAVGAVFRGSLFTPLNHLLLSVFLLNSLVTDGAVGYLLLRMLKLWLMLLVFEVALAVAGLDEML